MDTERDSGRRGAPRGTRSRWGVAVVCCAAVTAALIFVAWAKIETVQITYRIDELMDEEERLGVEQRGLRSKLAEIRSPRALEALAPGLGLVPPEPGQVVVVSSDPDGLAAALEPAPEVAAEGTILGDPPAGDVAGHPDDPQGAAAPAAEEPLLDSIAPGDGIVPADPGPPALGVPVEGEAQAGPAPGSEPPRGTP